MSSPASSSRKAASPEDVSLRHVVLGLSKMGAAREQEATVRRAGLMAAFPLAYAVVLSALYLPLMALLRYRFL